MIEPNACAYCGRDREEARLKRSQFIQELVEQLYGKRLSEPREQAREVYKFIRLIPILLVVMFGSAMLYEGVLLSEYGAFLYDLEPVLQTIFATFWLALTLVAGILFTVPFLGRSRVVPTEERRLIEKLDEALPPVGTLPPGIRFRLPLEQG